MGPASTSAACSRPASRSSTCGARSRTTTATSRQLRLDPLAGLHRLLRPRHADERLLPLARHEAEADDDARSRSAVGDTGLDPATLRRAGPGQRRGARRAALRRRRRRPPDRPRRHASTCPRAPASRPSRSARAADGRQRRRSSRSRASTTPRSAASSRPPISTPRDSRAPVLIGIDAGLGRFSPNGDGRFDEAIVDRDLLGDGRLDGRVQERRRARSLDEPHRQRAATFDVDLGRPRRRHRGPRRHVHLDRSRRRRLAERRSRPAAARSSSTRRAPSTSPRSARAASGRRHSARTATACADTISTSVTVPRPARSWSGSTNDGNTTVRTWTSASTRRRQRLTWDGRASDGPIVPDGEYTIHDHGPRRVGNSGAGATRTVRVVGLLGCGARHR